MEYRYQIGQTIKTVRIERAGDAYRVSVDGAEFREVRIAQSQAGAFDLDFFGARKRVYVAHDGQKRLIAIGSAVYEFRIAERGARRADHGMSAGVDDLTAAMPGQVIAVHVREGDAVAHGQTLVILEAMKMEMRVVAPHAGMVQKVFVSMGQVVERGQRLVEIVAT